MGSNSMDDSILATVIFGRIEPKIYAFETATIPNYLKVGDTFRTVEERLNEWRNAGFKNLCPIGDWSAEIEGKDVYFRDYSVHDFLEPHHERLTRDIFPDKPYSQEFFKNASKADVEEAIEDIVNSFDKGGSNYTYYGIKERTTKEPVFPRDSFEWKPREPLQTDAINRFLIAKNNNRENLLMYAVMRFGKSFTSLCCAKAMNAKFVLVVSGKADVADEWRENVQRPKQFENFVFLNSTNLKRNDKAISKAQKEDKCIVLFLTLQDLSKEKKRFKELFETPIDLMIIDETHFGARAETLGKVIADAHYKKDTYLVKIENDDGIDKEALSSLQGDKAEKELEKATKDLNVRYKLHLSGTPYRILMGNEFEKDDIVSFCQYSDIISEKERWYNENIADGRQEETGREEWENPYYGFPQMVRFAFNLNESSMNRIKQLEEEGYSYRLSALFAPQSIEKDDDKKYRKFVYEIEVLDFLHTIDGSKKDNNVLSFLDNQRIKDGKLCNHIVMVLPYCASCDAMETLIAENKSSFNNLSEYEIINISGIDSKKYTISEVKNKIKGFENDKIKTITLTVNRMLTGCTVPEWDTMIFLKDTASPQDYDQAIFRLQSQYVVEYEGTKNVDGREIKLSMKKDMKPQTLLVDFNPQRMFYLQETKSRIYNINTKDGGNEESEKRIKRDLEVSPIIHISDNKLVEVTPTDILKAVSEYSVNRGITEAANDIIVDTNLINIESIKRIIDKEFEITSGKGLVEQTYTGDEIDLDYDDVKTDGDTDNKKDAESKDLEESEKGTTGEETVYRVFIKKCRSYYRRILFYAFLCKSDDAIKSLDEVLKSVNTQENERIFKNLGIDKAFLKLMKESMNGSALRSLDDKIFDLYRLSHEYDNEDNDPIKRAITAIKSFGKISDSEVVTPQNIAKEMVDQIPEEDFVKIFNNDGKILDIASKMGEFATAVYRRAISLNISVEKIQYKVYSIPTSPLAYEFTRFVYEKLGLCVDTIAYHFSSYDLLEVKRTIKTGKKAGQLSKEIDFNRISALLTQNKKFDEIKMSDAIAEGDDKVKFNIVVGNPPYQANVSTGKDNDSLGKQLFPTFTEMVYSTSSQYCSLITPSRWFTGDAQDKSFVKLRSFLKEKNNIVKMFIYPTTDEVFSDVVIKGGVNHFLVDKNSNSDVEFHTIKNGIDSTEQRKLFEEGFDVVFRSVKDSTIVRKIVNNSHETLFSITTGRNAFGIIGKPESLKKQTTDKKTGDSITVHCKSGEKRYIAKSQVTKGVDIMEHYKAFISKSAGDPDTDTKVIGVPFFGDKNSVCTDTYFPIGCFDTEVEAKNLCKYLKTVFVRYLINVLKSSQNVTQIVYRFVPMQDFTNSSDIDWSKSISEIDEKLYEKYELLPDEIAYIKSTIKPME